MGQRLSDLLTPCLVLERGKLHHNIQRMAQKAEQLGISLRPHVKTCKSADIAALLAPARACITVSTLQESEGTSLMGVMTHAGESYECRSAQELENHAEQERRLCVQAGLGVCSLEDIVLSVLTTVVSHKTSHRRLIIGNWQRCNGW